MTYMLMNCALKLVEEITQLDIACRCNDSPQAGRFGVRTPVGEDIFFSAPVGTVQPPVQWVPAHFRGGKRLVCGVGRLPQSGTSEVQPP